MATKTIVITLPRHLTTTTTTTAAGGATSTLTPSQPPTTTTTTILPTHLSTLLAGKTMQLIKNEPGDTMAGDDDVSKPPRKRQRLDHLSMEEKLMRR